MNKYSLFKALINFCLFSSIVTNWKASVLNSKICYDSCLCAAEKLMKAAEYLDIFPLVARCFPALILLFYQSKSQSVLPNQSRSFPHASFHSMCLTLCFPSGDVDFCADEPKHSSVRYCLVWPCLKVGPTSSPPTCREVMGRNTTRADQTFPLKRSN